MDHFLRLAPPCSADLLGFLPDLAFDQPGHLRLATVSNIGGATMTVKDRKRVAEYLYTETEEKPRWTMQAIADGLGVSKYTISMDLVDFNCLETKQLKHAKTETNKRGAGRPPGSVNKRETATETAPLARANVHAAVRRAVRHRRGRRVLIVSL